ETDVTVRVHASEEVHLTLKLPRHAHVGRVMSRNGKIEIAVVSGELNATLSNGDMRIERLRGSVTAACGNGRVVVREVATLLSAEVSNGSIEVTLQKTLERDLVLKAGNGQIRLQLPPTPNCELNAHISVGNISTPWRKVAGVGRLQLAEKLGSGGPLVSVTVSVGQIVVTV
ncbi:MAG TPA: DUF4097 family beta strand repeat-containing protein, partial [Planctomycetota bacterium]|nr:DUF4097 family beta strand repeat-containing protein [Planctomycetota bacterium]